MSEKDTALENLQNNISKNESQTKSNVTLFEFINLKSKANIILSDYNLFNYDFDTKTLLDINKKEKDIINPKENPNLNTIKNINIELPSTQKINEQKFFNKFIDEYETSFAHFCEIDKKKYVKAFQGKKYIPYLDKFGNIKISVKNLMDLLKSYSHSLKLKIRRRFIKKYKKKKIFKTFKNIKNDDEHNIGNLFEIKENTVSTNYNNNNISNHKYNNNERIKLISLKKNLKISLKKNSNNNSNTKEKENSENNNNNNNNMDNYLILSNNLFNNNNEIFFSNNNIIKSSLINAPITNENIFNFSSNDQNIFNFNLPAKNVSDILNKKILYTPYTPYTPFYNNNINNNNNNITNNNNNVNNNPNTSNKKNNNQFNFNFNIPNNLISPQIFSPSPYQDFLTPNSIHFSASNLQSPYNHDKFTFANIRNNNLLFGSLNNQSPMIINNNINVFPTHLNINNNPNNKNDNGNLNMFYKYFINKV